MNVENLKRVRDLIAARPKTFCQGGWLHPDARPTDVAAFATEACGGKLVRNTGAWSVEWKDADGTKRTAALSAYATMVLDLTAAQARAMFAGKPFDAEHFTWIRFPSAIQTLAMLDRAIETGEVRWNINDDPAHLDGTGITVG